MLLKPTPEIGVEAALAGRAAVADRVIEIGPQLPMPVGAEVAAPVPQRLSVIAAQRCPPASWSATPSSAAAVIERLMIS
jgi:hypothetical protein